MKQEIKIGHLNIVFEVDIEILETEVFDTDRLTYINFNNLIGEMLTISTQMNRVGFMLAKKENEVDKAKFALEVQGARFKERIRETESPNKSASGVDKGWTRDQVEDAWCLSKKYQMLKTNFIKKTFERDVVNSLYWSVKYKSEKLEKLSLTLNRSDLDIDESFIINGIKVELE